MEIKKKVFNDAKSIFGIKNKAELFLAIINLKKSDMKFIKTRTFHSTDEIPPPKADSYMFVYKFVDGYLAFYHSKDKSKWVIKSFKKYDDRYETFENEIGRQLREHGLI
ncbi:MAG: hypothetical protein KAH33_03810 [Candidatus Delongbacteria bacterium]|nr:hypothetical protein [Candidatus Delongbacteria bacterium]